LQLSAEVFYRDSLVSICDEETKRGLSVVLVDRPRLISKNNSCIRVDNVVQQCLLIKLLINQRQIRPDIATRILNAVTARTGPIKNSFPGIGRSFDFHDITNNQITP
jgi:hypothetical protein